MNALIHQFFAPALLAVAMAAAAAPDAAFGQAQDTASAAAAVGAQMARYQAARDQYEVGHFDVAFAAFVQLADEGHCESARIAHQMARHGRALYAMEFPLQPARLERWRAMPGCATAALATR